MDEKLNGIINENDMENNTDSIGTTVSPMLKDNSETQEIFSDSSFEESYNLKDSISYSEENDSTSLSDENISSDNARSFSYSESNTSVERPTYRSPFNYSEPVHENKVNDFNPYAQQSQYIPTQQAQSPVMTKPAVPAPKKKKSKRPLLAVLAICASLIISGGSFYAGVRYVDDNNTAVATSAQTSEQQTSTPVISNTNTVSTSTNNDEITSSITQVVENAMPSMVSINTIIEKNMNDYGYYNFFFGGGSDQTYESSASGSGIIIGQNEEELLIVTNYHVIEDAKQIAIEFINGESYSAEVKGTASENDLAVVSVKLSDISADTLSKIKVAVLGDSTTLKLGEPAIAIGNSLGYGQSVTVGYISATERTVEISDKTMTLIQTDAAINPGNSGGALLNIKGEVIGINSAKLSSTSVEGTGYAIPISDAAPIINDLMSSTHVSDEEKPYLGIYGSGVPETYQSRFNWPAGVYISRVIDGSPAQLAGLESGDIITAIDNTDVKGMEDLETILAQHKVGDKITITIARTDAKGNVKTGTVTATLIAKSESDSITTG